MYFSWQGLVQDIHECVLNSQMKGLLDNDYKEMLTELISVESESSTRHLVSQSTNNDTQCQSDNRSSDRHLCRTSYVCQSFRQSARNNSAPNGLIVLQFGIWVVLKKLCREFKFDWSKARIMCTLHKDLWTFIIMSRWILLRMRNVWDKIYRENQNTF